jgi:hypothetical protein
MRALTGPNKRLSHLPARWFGAVPLSVSRRLGSGQHRNPEDAASRFLDGSATPFAGKRSALRPAKVDARLFSRHSRPFRVIPTHDTGKRFLVSEGTTEVQQHKQGMYIGPRFACVPPWAIQ